MSSKSNVELVANEGELVERRKKHEIKELNDRQFEVLLLVLKNYDYLYDEAHKLNPLNYNLKSLSFIDIILGLLGISDLVSDWALSFSIINGVECGGCGNTRKIDPLIVVIAYILLFTSVLGLFGGIMFRLNTNHFKFAAIRIVFEDCFGFILGVFAVTALKPSLLSLTSLIISILSVVSELVLLVYQNCKSNEMRSMKRLIAQSFTLLILVVCITIPTAMFVEKDYRVKSAYSQDCTFKTFIEDEGSNFFDNIYISDLGVQCEGSGNNIMTGFVSNELLAATSCTNIVAANTQTSTLKCNPQVYQCYTTDELASLFTCTAGATTNQLRIDYKNYIATKGVSSKLCVGAEECSV